MIKYCFDCGTQIEIDLGEITTCPKCGKKYDMSIQENIPDKILARMLLKLLREHKKNCNSSNCGISVYYFLSLWKRLMGRKPTEKEFTAFV